MFFYEIPFGQITNCPSGQEKYPKFRLFFEEVDQLPKENDFNKGIYMWTDDSVSKTYIYVDGHIVGEGSGTFNYDELSNKPKINGTEISGDLSTDDLGFQGKLTPGGGVTIDENNVISAHIDGTFLGGDGITIEGNVISITGFEGGDIAVSNRQFQLALDEIRGDIEALDDSVITSVETVHGYPSPELFLANRKLTLQTPRISRGTSLPTTGMDGDIFLLYS